VQDLQGFATLQQQKPLNDLEKFVKFKQQHLMKDQTKQLNEVNELENWQHEQLQ
jgi:hypothetical protein